MKQTHIWWIRRDIRLHDNPALQAALQGAHDLIPVFILEPDLLKKAAPKRKDFLCHALDNLNQSLQAAGSRLIILQGPALAAFQTLKKSIGQFQIFAQEDFSPFSKERDRSIAAEFPLNLLPGVVWQHPEAVKKDDGDPYIVYTPYKNKWLSRPLPTPADGTAPPKKMPPIPKGINTIPLPEWQPVKNFAATAAEARQRLTTFCQSRLAHYDSQRDRLDLEGTSQLSPYLRFGLISAREAFTEAQTKKLQNRKPDTQKEIQTWINELIWREFYTAILYHFPHVLKGPFRKEYTHIPWRDAPDDLQAWQEGRTGYPVVDAAMRQLSATGWMHNRGRMIVASFLTKDLLINWQAGEDWFMAHLVDGDPAANNGGWQWSAGTGTDAAPYFRIFNPILQGKKFDPDGAYIAQWVPELASLPPKYRHEPWKIKSDQADLWSFRPGKDYPQPIVDHKSARERTLEAYRFAKDTYKGKEEP